MSVRVERGSKLAFILKNALSSHKLLVKIHIFFVMTNIGLSPSSLVPTLSTSCCLGRHIHQLCFISVLVSSSVSSQGETENKRAAAANVLL